MAAAAVSSEIDDPQEVLSIILDPDRRGALYPYYHRLRELAPVLSTQQLSHDRAWIITRFADARAVLANLKMVSDRRTVEIFDVGPEGERYVDIMSRMILYRGLVDHNRIRRLVARMFTPRAVDKHRPQIQRIVDELIDGLEDAGEFDLISQFAYLVPVYVICELLGVPHEDFPVFKTWAYDFARRGDLSGLNADDIRRGEEAVQGFESYFEDLIVKRLAAPQDDLISTIVLLEDELGRLSTADVVAMCVLLLQAGHETSADMIGMGTRQLLLQPDQWDLLRREPPRIQNAVEEMIRFETPVQVSQRVGPDPIQIGNVDIPAGELLVLLSGAINRDPAKFPDPDTLDITRSNVTHLGFGLGNYICLGASVARAEIQIAIDTLVRRLPNLELVSEEAEYRPTLYLRGLRALPLLC